MILYTINLRVRVCVYIDENNGENWGCGGMSEEIAAIHFSSSMTLLFKPKGKNKKSVFERLMSDWTAVEDSEWTLRPISAGNSHDRLIERAKIVAIGKIILKQFVKKDIGQFAFGTRCGSIAVAITQQVHQDKHPTHVTDACDGSNAYNEARREKIAEGIVKAKVKKLRCGYGYFLMGHRTATCIYIKGILECVAKSDSGVRQGNPGAGMMYCVGQADMLNAMVGDLHSQKMRVRIAAIVDDISMQGEVSIVAAAHKWLKDNGE